MKQRKDLLLNYEIIGKTEYSSIICKTGEPVVDVGTDHGYVPIELAQRGIISHGLAMDVRKGPLERQKSISGQYGLEDVIGNPVK